LEVRCSPKELLEQWKDAITFKETLQTAQQAHIQLDISPCSSIDLLLQCFGDPGQDLRGELWLAGVDEEDNGCDEGDSQWLLNRTGRGKLANSNNQES
jgi:hypothetical protein